MKDVARIDADDTTITCILLLIHVSSSPDVARIDEDDTANTHWFNRVLTLVHPKPQQWTRRWVAADNLKLQIFTESGGARVASMIISEETEVHLQGCDSEKGGGHVSSSSREVQVVFSSRILYLRSLADTAAARHADVRQWKGMLSHAVESRKVQNTQYTDAKGRVFARMTDAQVRARDLLPATHERERKAERRKTNQERVQERERPPVPKPEGCGK
jgi:hypothetical protein